MPDDPKFCTSCKHFIAPGPMTGGVSVCASPRLGRSPVDGSPIRVGAELERFHPDLITAPRIPMKRCGIEGAWWEKRSAIIGAEAAPPKLLAN